MRGSPKGGGDALTRAPLAGLICRDTTCVVFPEYSQLVQYFSLTFFGLRIAHHVVANILAL